MGVLYDKVLSIERAIEARGLDGFKVKGEIGLKAGFFLVLITPESPDDPEKIAALTSAMRDVLGDSVA